MTIVSATGVSKAYRLRKQAEPLHALNGVSFSLSEGDLVGYIGPNGAGKSTTVKILSGILVPDSGQVEVFGKIPWKHRIDTVREIGVVFGQRTQLWWDLPVIESFQLLKSIYRLSSIQYAQQLEELVSRLDLQSLLSMPVRLLSLGQRMRCDLAASLLHTPRLLFLDEPTIGLDAQSKLAVRDFILKINEEKRTTVLLTTHDMDDIEALCKRVMILNQGSICFQGSLSTLRQQISPERHLIVDFGRVGVSIDEEGVEIIRREGHRVRMRFNPHEISPSALIAKISAKEPVTDLFVENPPIEALIAKYYNGL